MTDKAGGGMGRLADILKRTAREIVAPRAVLKEKYSAFMELLASDRLAHAKMARLEEVYHRQTAIDLKQIEHDYGRLADSVAGMVAALARIAPAKYRDLEQYFGRLDGYIRYFLQFPPFRTGPPYAAALADIDARKGTLWGGKATNLAIAASMGLPVPAGFAISTSAMGSLLEYNNLLPLIDNQLMQLDTGDAAAVKAVSDKLVALLKKARIPLEVEKEIAANLEKIQNEADGDLLLAVRSSAMGEDGKVSFAGQYRSLLGVPPDKLWQAYLEVVASRYSPEALVYRINQGLADSETPMAVLVMAMVDAKAAGVVYSADVSGNASRRISIFAVPGLGTKLVDGSMKPETVTLHPNQVKSGNARDLRIPENFPIDRQACLQLANWALVLQEKFGCAQDLEWAYDHTGRLYLLQTRSLQQEKMKVLQARECVFEQEGRTVLLEGGIAASLGIAAGPVFKMVPGRSIANVPLDSVMVVDDAAPRFVAHIHRLNAIVAEKGSQAGHLASVAREFGIPLLVQAERALELLEDGKIVTVNADLGKVFDGKVESMLKSPCAKWKLEKDNPFMRRMAFILEFISPLRLDEPFSDSFRVEKCRSLHDIIRFSHQKAVEELFRQHQRRIFGIPGSKKLKVPIPLQILVVDLDSGLKPGAAGKREISLADVVSKPMLSLFRGLLHPGIKWGYGIHFDWASHDQIVMSGGLVSAKAAMFASYALVDRNYANLNFKFGYHFVVVDTFFSSSEAENYVFFRFAGGGAELDSRLLRADLLERILVGLGFDVKRIGDVVDARLETVKASVLERSLDYLGRLLGATRLMDMYLKKTDDLDALVADFMNGRYDFSSADG